MYLLDDFPVSHPDLDRQVCRCGVLPDFHVDVRSGDLILNGIKTLGGRDFIDIKQRLGEIIRGRTVWRQQKVAEGVVVQAIFLLDWWQLYAAS